MSKAYFIYLLKRNKKLIFVQFAILIAIFSLIKVQMNGAHREDVVMLYLNYYLASCTIIYPIYLHTRNFKQNGNDLFASLPMKKEKFYFTEIVFGVFLIFVPYFIALLFLPLTSWAYNFLVLISIAVIMLAVYMFNHFLLVKCNNLMDGIIIVLTINLALWIFPSVLIQFLSYITITSTNFTYMGILSYLAVDNPIVNLLYASPYYVTSVLREMTLHGISYNMTFNVIILICYLMSSILLVFANLISFRNKKVEVIGGKSISAMSYPFVISLVTIIGIVYIMAAYEINIAIIAFIILFCFYIGAFAFADRKISISWKRIISYVAMIIAIMMLRVVFITTNGFQTYNQYKNYDIEDVTVDISQDLDYFSLKYQEDTGVSDEQNVLAKDNMKKELDDIITLLIEDFKEKNLLWNDRNYVNLNYIYLDYNDGLRYVFKAEKTQVTNIKERLMNSGMYIVDESHYEYE